MVNLGMSDPPPLTLEEVQRLAGDPEAAARQALALLLTLLAEDEELRAWTNDALQTIASPPDELANTLCQHCEHASPVVASWSCKLLGRLGGSNAKHQSALAGTLAKHPNTGVRQQAALALSEMGELTPTSLEALRQASVSDDARLQRIATSTLEKLAA